MSGCKLTQALREISELVSNEMPDTLCDAIADLENINGIASDALDGARDFDRECSNQEGTE